MPKFYAQHRQILRRKTSWVIKLITLSVIVFFVWSYYALLDEVVRGPGTVVPTSQTQVIQSLEGGILAELPVWEGKEVKAGEVVARLSDRQFKGAFEELETKVTALEARLYRLDKELAFARHLNFPKKICVKARKICQSEYNLFKANQTEYLSGKKSITTRIDLQRNKVSMLKDLAEKDIAPELDYIKAQQELNEALADLSGFESEYALSRSKEHSDTLTELNQYRATKSVRRDKLNRTELTAPVRSIVNKIEITTIGGVAPAGKPILELTPLDDELRVEAQISPKDVAFIYPNMPATVKLTAYDYTIYGSLKGKVVHVSADTFEDPNKRDAPPYYKVFIEVTEDAIKALTKDIDIRPGMVADVELETGKKTVFQYLFKPLFKSTEAFRER